nr:expressed protein [Hymenolepis microstoma]
MRRKSTFLTIALICLLLGGIAIHYGGSRHDFENQEPSSNIEQAEKRNGEIKKYEGENQEEVKISEKTNIKKETKDTQEKKMTKLTGTKKDSNIDDGLADSTTTTEVTSDNTSSESTVSGSTVTVSENFKIENKNDWLTEDNGVMIEKNSRDFVKNEQLLDGHLIE